MDVNTAFLNEDLEEEIYIDQLEGCVVSGKEKNVCKLVKSLYGLKQAPKQWHNKFDHVLVTNGYSKLRMLISVSTTSMRITHV